MSAPALDSDDIDLSSVGERTLRAHGGSLPLLLMLKQSYLSHVRHRLADVCSQRTSSNLSMPEKTCMCQHLASLSPLAVLIKCHTQLWITCPACWCCQGDVDGDTWQCRGTSGSTGVRKSHRNRALVVHLSPLISPGSAHGVLTHLSVVRLGTGFN